jgi:hypothetical protein
MAKQTINIGTTPNDGTGDALRNAFDKTNSNFTELYDDKQDELVSGTNIKTVNGNSLLGSGDLVVGGSSGITVGTTSVTSGTVGRVFFQGSGNVVQQDSALFWDNTNKRLGVGATPSSTVRLDVRAQGALSTDIAFRVRNSADTYNILEVKGDGNIQHLFNTSSEFKFIGNGGSFINIIQTSAKMWMYGNQGGANSWLIGTNATNTEFNFMLGDKGNLIIGNSAPGVKPNEANTRTLYMVSGTAPALNYTDGFQLYSNDITAGNAAPHFRTENGNIIKLYQQSSAGITTVGQLVTVLQNLGLLS